jgi:2,4-diketo-3-deoxy-L-fuconate hydrolase
MKFLRYGEPGAEKPGLLDADGQIRDLSGLIPDLAGEVLGRLDGIDTGDLPLVSGKPRRGPCVGGIGKMVCIGLNYSDHAKEAGKEPPPEPIIFMKATSAIVGPDDTVVLPRGSKKGDWEIELGIVIGKTAKYVSEAEALDHVAGYCIVNDVSERELQAERSGQWTKGKSCDTFGPTGPWLVTPDEVGDPQALAMTLDVNGERMQTGSTADMIFGAAYLVSYLSQMMTLHPGDVIATGTPAGVGLGMRPQRFLKAGDVMEVTIEKLGRQRQEVVAD